MLEYLSEKSVSILYSYNLLVLFFYAQVRKWKFTADAVMRTARRAGRKIFPTRLKQEILRWVRSSTGK